MNIDQKLEMRDGLLKRIKDRISRLYEATPSEIDKIVRTRFPGFYPVGFGRPAEGDFCLTYPPYCVIRASKAAEEFDLIRLSLVTADRGSIEIKDLGKYKTQLSTMGVCVSAHLRG